MGKLQPWLERSCPLPAGRVREWGPAPLDEIDVGIVFIFAGWSAPSIAAFRRLTSMLATEFPEARIPVLVVNADDVSPDEHWDMLGIQSHGWGETAWVRNGRIIGTLNNAGGVPAAAPGGTLGRCVNR